MRLVTCPNLEAAERHPLCTAACMCAELCKLMAQVYIESILALQQKACEERGEAVKLEMVIMTSDDTHSRTQALLDDNAYFGMQPDQMHLLKQEKVCL